MLPNPENDFIPSPVASFQATLGRSAERRRGAAAAADGGIIRTTCWASPFRKSMAPEGEAVAATIVTSLEQRPAFGPPAGGGVILAAKVNTRLP